MTPPLSTMTRLLHLISVDLALFLRSRLALFWTFAFPLFILIMQMTLFGQDLKLGPISLALIDRDRSPLSQDYLKHIKQEFLQQQFIEVTFPQEITHGNADLTLTIPSGFSINAARAQSTTLTMDDTLPDGPARAAAHGLLRGFNNAYNLTRLHTPPLLILPAVVPTETSLSPTNPASGSASSNELNYRLFLVTGLAGLILLSTSLMGFATPLVAAREGGMFRMYQLFPLHPGMLIIAWGLSRLVITVVASLAMFLAAHLIYGIALPSNGMEILCAIAVLILGYAAFLALGLLIASLSASVVAATMICNILYFPLFFSGNLMIPLGNLPLPLREILAYMPLNAMIESIRHSLTIGLSWHNDAYNLCSLIVMLIVCLVLASRYFTWAPK